MENVRKIAAKLEFVKVGETAYLGIFNEDGNLTDAHEVDDNHMVHGIVEWFEKQNLGTLQVVKFSTATSYTSRTLDEEELALVDRCITEMGLAKKVAIPKLINQYFNERMENGNR